MKTIIANPLYDVVFKHLMENKPAAKVLLSALLKVEVLDLTPGRNEFTNTLNKNVSIFRIDFSALIIDKNGEKKNITIEVQKTWGSHEILRFRQYLGKQYLAPENVHLVQDGKDRKGYYGIPLTTIYLLGHTIGDMDEAVIYINRKYSNYEGEILPYKDRFIESLSHDSIIVQVPFLQKRPRNRVERILQIFNQSNTIKQDNNHTIVLNEEELAEEEKDIAPIIRCLNKIVADPQVREDMEIEDLYVGEIEMKNNELLEKDKEIEKKAHELEQKSHEIKQKSQELKQKSQEIKQKSQELKQKSQEVEQKTQLIEQKSQEIEQNKQELEQNKHKLEQNKQELELNKQELEQKSQELEQNRQEMDAKDKEIEELRKLLNSIKPQ